jgi:hypothetical protein
MSPLLLVTLCVSALYGWVAWRLERAPSAASVRLLLPLALLAHGALIYQSVLGQGDIRLGFGNSLSTILWLTRWCIGWQPGAPAGAPAVVGQRTGGAVRAGHGVFTATRHPNSQALALRTHLVVSFLAWLGGRGLARY